MATATQTPPLPFPPLCERIERFRRASRARGAQPPASPKMRHFMHAFFELHSHLPYEERYARSLAHAIGNEPVHVFDDGRLVDMLYQGREGRPETSSYAEQWKPFSHGHHTRRPAPPMWTPTWA